MLALLIKHFNMMSISDLIKAIIVAMVDSSETQRKIAIIEKIIQHHSNSSELMYYCNLRDFLIEQISDNELFGQIINSTSLVKAIYGLVVNNTSNNSVIKEIVKVLIKINEVISKDLFETMEIEDNSSNFINEKKAFYNCSNWNDMLLMNLYKTSSKLIEDFCQINKNPSYINTSFSKSIETLNYNK